MNNSLKILLGIAILGTDFCATAMDDQAMDLRQAEKLTSQTEFWDAVIRMVNEQVRKVQTGALPAVTITDGQGLLKKINWSAYSDCDYVLSFDGKKVVVFRKRI